MGTTIRELAMARREVERLQATIKDFEAELADTDLGRSLAITREELAWQKALAAECEAWARDEAVREFKLTGDKKALPGVTIKEYAVLTYDDDRALTYSREHIPNAVKLDKKAFEKAAQALALDFVQISTEPRATIATDLSEYLE